MRINRYGTTFLEEKEIFDNLYFGNLKKLSDVYTDKKTTEKFNNSKNLNKDSFDNLNLFLEITEDIKDFDKLNQSNWFMPNDYCVDLIDQIYAKCKNQTEIERVNQELELFQKHNMIDLLFYLKYLVDTMRQNNIVWGVGRGSSVASYTLYLIGVHKINSLKYNLDIKEFLK